MISFNWNFPCCELFFQPQSYKSPRKTAMRHLVEQQFRNGRVRHILCERTPTPSRNEFTRVHWGYKFLWISAVLPVLWATVLRFNSIGAKNLRSKAHQNSADSFASFSSTTEEFCLFWRHFSKSREIGSEILAAAESKIHVWSFKRNLVSRI